MLEIKFKTLKELEDKKEELLRVGYKELIEYKDSLKEVYMMYIYEDKTGYACIKVDTDANEFILYNTLEEK